jgi:hypothetical protein
VSRSSGAAKRAREPSLLKWLLVLVVGVLVITLLTPWLSRYGLGRLPGDITVRWRGRPVYLPITTTLLLSALLTLVARVI